MDMIKEVMVDKGIGTKILKEGISNNGLSIYLALFSLELKNTRLIHINSIYYELTNDKNISRQFKDNIKKGILELDKKYIDIISVSKDCYEINFNKMFEDEVVDVVQALESPFDNTTYEETNTISNYYTFVTISSIHLIYKLGGSNLIAYWFKLLNLINSLYVNYSLDDLALLTDLSKGTIIKYNDFLVDCKAIYIHKHIHKYANTNKKLNNMYGLYENKDKIIELANNYLEENKSNIK